MARKFPDNVYAPVEINTFDFKDLFMGLMSALASWES